MAQIITHRGTVENVGKGSVKVRIIQLSACSSCVARKMCNSSEQKEKHVDVTVSEGEHFQTGDEVMLTGTLKMGLRAVVLAYAVPLVLLLAALFLSIRLTGDEPLGALTALLVLVAYYGVLYVNKSRLTKKFSFTIKHLNK